MSESKGSSFAIKGVLVGVLGTVGAVVKTCGRHADDVARLTRHSDDVVAVARHADDVVDVARHADDVARLGSHADDLARGARSADAAMDAGRSASRAGAVVADAVDGGGTLRHVGDAADIAVDIAEELFDTAPGEDAEFIDIDDAADSYAAPLVKASLNPDAPPRVVAFLPESDATLARIAGMTPDDHRLRQLAFFRRTFKSRFKDVGKLVGSDDFGREQMSQRIGALEPDACILIIGFGRLSEDGRNLNLALPNGEHISAAETHELLRRQNASGLIVACLTNETASVPLNVGFSHAMSLAQHAINLVRSRQVTTVADLTVRARRRIANFRGAPIAMSSIAAKDGASALTISRPAD
ncbi:MAG TPA: hypothetical protein P5081_03430 [Phycisphaerae bacterium]|nr:hypothetical protein [Phycisphaerae bacterium]